MDVQQTIDILGQHLTAIRNDLQRQCEDGTGIVAFSLDVYFVPALDGIDAESEARVAILSLKTGNTEVHKLGFSSHLDEVKNG